MRTASLLAAALAAAACSTRPSAAKPAADSTADPRQRPVTLTADQREHVRIVSAESVTYRPTVEANGTVAFDGNISTQVLAPISGPVLRLAVEVGAQVKKGDVLAYVSSPDFAAAIAAYRKTQAAAAQARKVADLDTALYGAEGISRRDMEQAEVDAQSAEADREAAIQQLRALGVDSATIAALREGKSAVSVQAAVRAPLAGTVVEKLITPGQLLQAGTTPCFTVADLSRMWVMASVFESDLPYVAAGDPARITGAAVPKPIDGVTDYVAALVDPNTRATTVRIDVPNPGHVLKKDMYVQAAIRSSKTVRGVLVPVAAVLRDEDNLPYVFVETPQGAFARRQVTLGARVGDDYQVRAGLAGGEKVIAEGGLFLEFQQTQ